METETKVPTVSIYAAARHLGVCWRTLAKWIDSGRLVATGTNDSRTMTVEALNEFCRKYDFSEYWP